MQRGISVSIVTHCWSLWQSTLCWGCKNSKLCKKQHQKRYVLVQLTFISYF